MFSYGFTCEFYKIFKEKMTGILQTLPEYKERIFF